VTDLEAGNKALMLLGVAPIGSLSDNTQPARVISRLLDPAKRAVLSDFAWSFAIRLQPLYGSATPAPAGYSRAYNYPADAVNLYAVYGPTPDIKIPFLRAGRYVYTRDIVVSAKYTTAETDLNNWSSGAAEALVNRLASDAAVALMSNPQLSLSLLEKYSALINAAKTNSLNEEYTDPYSYPMIADPMDKEVVNKALMLVGIRPIGGLIEEAGANKALLTDAAQAGRIMSELLPTAKRAVLSDFAWSFALRSEALAEIASIPAPGYFYVYEYPSDAVNLYGVYSEREQVLKVPFVRIDDEIHARRAAVCAVYTAEVMDLSKWSRGAVEALISRLASDAATALIGNPQLSITLLEKYGLLLTIARGNSANEEYAPGIRPTHYIDVRR
jgi:hypothetical protein